MLPTFSYPRISFLSLIRYDFSASSLSKQALPIADLSKIEVGVRTVGGMPQSIAWDPNGQYLAIIFKDSPNVVVFATSIHKHQFSISPSCFITGIGVEFPSYICFQSKNRKNSDSVLTIGWSSGRVQYFPFANMWTQYFMILYCYMNVINNLYFPRYLFDATCWFCNTYF